MRVSLALLVSLACYLPGLTTQETAAQESTGVPTDPETPDLKTPDLKTPTPTPQPRTTADSASPSAAPSDDTEIDQLVESLDASRYRDRSEASRRLMLSRGRAFEALQEAVLEGNAETAGRAFAILKHHVENKHDPTLQAKAEDVLKRIAEQVDHPKSLAAKRILDPQKEPNRAGRLPAPFLVPPAFAPRGKQVQVQIRIANGLKDVTVKENGNSIRVLDVGNGLQVEKKNGKGPLTKQIYKDAAELKLKDPDAHRVYQRGEAGFGLRIRPGRPVPGQPAAPRLPLPAPGDAKQDIQQRHQEINKRHKEIRRQLEQSLPRRSRPNDSPDEPLEV
ncbi:MAG: hypothetical protein ACR2NZ_08265 [Rubripirellula sp.]